MATLEVHDGRGGVRREAISRESTLLFGTSPKCDIVLEGEGIEPIHGRIRWKGSRFKVDASPDCPPIEVNGKLLTSSSLRKGDEVRVGNCRIFLIRDDAQPAADEPTIVQAPPTARTPKSGTLKAARAKAVARKAVQASRPSKLDSPDWFEALGVAPSKQVVEQEFVPEPRRETLSARLLRKFPLERLTSWIPRDDTPGREEIARSPLILGLAASIVALTLLGWALYGVIVRTTANNLFLQAIEDYDGGNYRNAADKFDRFLAANKTDSRAGRATVMSALSGVRQFASGAAPSWSNAVTAAREMVGKVGEVPAYRDYNVELGELVVAATEGLADRAKVSGDPAGLAEAEAALQLHRSIAGEATDAQLNRSRAPAKLADARAAVAKAQARLSTLAAMDAAIKASSPDGAYDARDALVAAYSDLAGDRSLIERLTKANDLIRAAAKFDPSRRPAESQPGIEPLGPPTTLVLRSPPAAAPPDTPTPPMVFALADGFAFGLDARSGTPLWQVPVGLSSPFRPQLIPGDESSVLAFDSRHDELLRLEARTGKLLWRQPMGEPIVAPPLVLGDQMVQAMPGGTLVVLDLGSGEVRGTLSLNRPLAGVVAADEAGQFFYVPGDEATLFVVARDPMACTSVEYLGHDSGTIPCPPARIGRYLVVTENQGIDAGRWRVFVLEQDGARPRPVQTVPLAGWGWGTPASSGSVIWGVSDRAGTVAYSLGPYESKAPFTPVARLAPDAESSGPAYALATTDRDVLIASGRSTRLTLDPERAALANAWTLGEAGPALAPPQLSGSLLILTQKYTEAQGVALWGVDPASGAVRWKTILGSAWPLPPTAMPDRAAIGVVDVRGKLAPLASERLHAGGFIERPLPQPGTFRLPAGELARVEVAGSVILVPRGQVDDVLVEDVAGDPRKLALPTPLAATPLAWGDGLLVPGVDGLVYWIDPKTGASRAEPLVPTFNRSSPTRWLAPVALEDGSVVLADASGKLRKLELPKGPAPRLVASQEVSLDQPLVADPASTGTSIVVATADGRVRSLSGRDFSPSGAWPIEARRVVGPVAVDGHVFVADAAGNLLLIGPDGRRLWSQRLRESSAAGPPSIREGQISVVGRDGAVSRFALADGTPIDRRELGVVPVGGPIPLVDGVVLPTGLGTLQLIRP
ncbi:PQQ-binding-like beta-propeller repeat protein [Isosphaeraceae bacterium EP7]